MLISQPSYLERAPPVFTRGWLRDGSADQHHEFTASRALPELESPFGDDLSQGGGHVIHVFLNQSLEPRHAVY
jgi:hypothetical protein